jgi:hypothetical protein
MTEKKVKEKVKALCKQYAAYYAMPMGTGFGNAGVPDFLICSNGRFIGIETKADKTKKPTALQEKNLAAIRAAGGVALVIHADNLDSLESYLAPRCKN